MAGALVTIQCIGGCFLKSVMPKTGIGPLGHSPLGLGSLGLVPIALAHLSLDTPWALAPSGGGVVWVQFTCAIHLVLGGFIR